MAWGLSNGYADLAYWGIATADITTPLSDDNALDPARNRALGNGPQASEPGHTLPTAAARSPFMASNRAAGSGPRHAADGPPEPVWTPEPIVTPKVGTLPAPVAEVMPPRMPNWDRSAVSASWPDAGWELAGETTAPHRPVPAHGRRRRRTRATTAVIVVSSLVTFFVAVTGVMVLLHHSATANATAGTAPTKAVTSSGATQLVAATRVADGATTKTGSELHALKGIPTTVTVAAVINPYVTSLQQYAAALSGPGVPAAARIAADDARALVDQDVQFLSTINGLQPIHLGSYLEQFGKNATQFQRSLGTLEHDLDASPT